MGRQVCHVWMAPGRLTANMLMTTLLCSSKAPVCDPESECQPSADDTFPVRTRSPDGSSWGQHWRPCFLTRRRSQERLSLWERNCQKSPSASICYFASRRHFEITIFRNVPDTSSRYPRIVTLPLTSTEGEREGLLNSKLRLVINQDKHVLLWTP